MGHEERNQSSGPSKKIREKNSNFLAGIRDLIGEQ